MQNDDIKAEENYISLASIDDADEVMCFINNEWKLGHILGVDKEYFLYEYGNNDLLNFVVSKNKNKINGILGFIKSSNDQRASFWTTMWMVSKYARYPMLGVRLLEYLRRECKGTVISSGINPAIEEICKYIGFQVGSLSHYYILNKNINIFKIAKINKFFKCRFNSDKKDEKNTIKKITLQEIEGKFNFNKYLKSVPYKDLDYFRKRYFDHPVYTYELNGAFNGSNIASIIVTRVARFESSACVRIVDFYGDESTLRAHTHSLIELMHQENYEYIDLVCTGLDEDSIFQSGFTKLDIASSNIIIPNYFEPFIRSNVNLRYIAEENKIDNLKIFKADGDQDRPSIVGKE